MVRAARLYTRHMQGLSTAERVHISLGERSYEIAIGRGLLAEPSAFGAARTGSDALIVTNTMVGPLYADRLAQALARRHRRVARLELPDGEVFNGQQNVLPDEYLKTLKVGDVLDDDRYNPLVWKRAV